MAPSARCMRSSRESAWRGNSAMPALMVIFWPPGPISSREMWRGRRATTSSFSSGGEGNKGSGETLPPDVAAQAVDDLLCLLGGRAHDGQRELVAAEAAADVARAQVHAEGAGQDAEALVAGGVAPAIVHLLEVVDVEGDDGHGVLLALGAAKLLLQALLERAVVEQAGERVLQGEGLEVLVHRV